MAGHTFTVDAQCAACNGTGLYVGMAERDGLAVVCHKCHGEGHHRLTMTWSDPEPRKALPGIRRVIEVNPGIVAIDSPEFGGMSYEEWVAGKPFEIGMEMRKYVCPAWWYQSVGLRVSLSWRECIVAGAFDECQRFANKSACWARWGREHQK